MEGLNSLEPISSLLRFGYDSWQVVTGLLVVAAALNRFKGTKPYVSGFVFPAFLLFFRKIALYIPLNGALSTEDQVIFWATGAFYYFALLLIIHAAVQAVIWMIVRESAEYGSSTTTEDILQVLVFGSLGIPLAGSLVLLPVDWPSHLVTPFLAHIGIAKILLVHPLFLPLVGVALVIHLWLALYRQGEAAKEINKFLLAALLVTGIAQFLLQPGRLEQTRGAIKIEESLFRSNNQVKETGNFLGDWQGKLAAIGRCKVNLVERTSEDLYQDCKIRELAANIPPLLASWMNDISVSQIAVISVLFLVLLALFEQFSRRQAAAVSTGDSDYYQPMGQWRELVVPSIRVKSVVGNGWLCLGAIGVALLMGAGALNDISWLIGFGVVGLSVWWMVAEYKLLVEGFVFDAWRRLAGAVVARDRKGRRGVSPVTLIALDRVDNLEEVLNSQPDSFLLALAATNNSNNYVNIVTRSLQPAASDGTIVSAFLAAHPACAMLTRVDFAVSNRQEWREDAIRLPPQSLWPRAVKTLAQSEYSEARLWAVRAKRLPDRRLRRLRWSDPDPDVRREAFELTKDQMTSSDVRRLIRSHYVDVRVRGIQFIHLRAELGNLYENDPDRAVRMAAWRRLNGDMPTEKAEESLKSKDLDLRPQAVQCGELPRRRLVELCARDWQREAREAAWEKLRQDLTAEEAKALSRSQYAEARLQAVESLRLPNARLIELCQQDSQQSVRRSAWRILQSHLTPREAEAVSRARDSVMRLCAVNSGLLTPERLQELSEDLSLSVREAARRRLQEVSNA